MSEILNANPTIRNASDLPSRPRQGTIQSLSKTPRGLFASTVPASAYLPDPFSPHSLDSDLSEEDDNEIEPIDEQEIYGELVPSYSWLATTDSHALPCIIGEHSHIPYQWMLC
jgi:hypothetical protein